MPKDPSILLSYINTLLRDHYYSLDDLCKSLNTDRYYIENKLKLINYEYNESENQFI